MNSMNISLPGPLKAFVDAQVADGRYGTASEYMRELIRADEKRLARERLETMLLEGLASAESEWRPGDLDAVRRAANASRG
jgi:antitoxin ParD1/3/4